jgi:hypothetical protein
VFILLSSASSAQYREDILRCLAAPVGSRLQFRYDKKWVAEGILERIKKGTLGASASGIVCWVDMEGKGPLRMIPVRAVKILHVNMHGRSLSVLLEMSELHYADPSSFTSEVFALSGNASPQVKSEKPEGKYFFEISTLPPSLRTGSTIGDWEELVSLLREEKPFQEEAFFWVALGMETEGTHLDTEVLSKWSTEPISKPFDLLVYHYQPRQARAVESKLAVMTSSDLATIDPPELAVDSRYDLKRWRFEPVRDQYRARDGWIRIRTNNKWDLDLDIRVKSSWGRGVFKSAVAGVLIAIPSILSIFTQKDVTIETQLILSGISVIAGFLAAAAVVFGFETFN